MPIGKFWYHAACVVTDQKHIFAHLQICRFRSLSHAVFLSVLETICTTRQHKRHTQGGVFGRSRLVALCRVVLLPGRSCCVVSWCVCVCRDGVCWYQIILRCIFACFVISCRFVCVFLYRCVLWSLVSLCRVVVSSLLVSLCIESYQYILYCVALGVLVSSYLLCVALLCVFWINYTHTNKQNERESKGQTTKDKQSTKN